MKRIKLHEKILNLARLIKLRNGRYIIVEKSSGIRVPCNSFAEVKEIYGIIKKNAKLHSCKNCGQKIDPKYNFCCAVCSFEYNNIPLRQKNKSN